MCGSSAFSPTSVLLRNRCASGRSSPITSAKRDWKSSCSVSRWRPKAIASRERDVRRDLEVLGLDLPGRFQSPRSASASLGGDPDLPARGQPGAGGEFALLEVRDPRRLDPAVSRVRASSRSRICLDGERRGPAAFERDVAEQPAGLGVVGLAVRGRRGGRRRPGRNGGRRRRRGSPGRRVRRPSPARIAARSAFQGAGPSPARRRRWPAPCPGPGPFRERDEPRGAVGRRGRREVAPDLGRAACSPRRASRSASAVSRAASRSRIAAPRASESDSLTAASGGGTCSTRATASSPAAENMAILPVTSRLRVAYKPPSPVALTEERGINARSPPVSGSDAAARVSCGPWPFWKVPTVRPPRAQCRAGRSGRHRPAADGPGRTAMPTPHRERIRPMTTPRHRRPSVPHAVTLAAGLAWAGSLAGSAPRPSGPNGGDRWDDRSWPPARRSSATTRAPRSRSRRTRSTTSTTGAASSTPRSPRSASRPAGRRSSAPSASATSWPTSSSTSTPAPGPTS